MNKFNFLFGVTIGIMTMLLVSTMPTTPLVKASSCSSSASAGGVSSAQRQAFAGQAALRQHTGDQGCSSGSVAVGGSNGGTRCFAADNGQAQLAQSRALVGGSQQSCSTSNQNQFLAK